MDWDYDVNQLLDLLFANPYDLDINTDMFNIEKLENPDLKLETDHEPLEYSDIDLDESLINEIK